MKCYETFELSFQGEAPKGSYAEVALSAVFTCGGEVLECKRLLCRK